MIKVKCICNEGFEDSISKGAVYPVIEVGANGYLVLDDKGTERWFGALKFKWSAE